jgi:hypothetical protein
MALRSPRFDEPGLTYTAGVGMPNIKLSPGRKMVLELLHHARKVPSIPVARELNVAAVLEQRSTLAQRPSWTAIFLRAYGLVCRDFAELRRVFVPYPFARLYEHPFSYGAVVVERELDDEPILLAAKILKPENKTLQVVDQCLKRLKTAPLHEISEFRQLLRFGKVPGFLRRFVFWHSLYWSGAVRARRFGTFMLSSYGNLGAEQIHPITPLTSLFTFGPIAADGRVIAKIIYDHRVMDGRRVATALAMLEEVMCRDVLREMLQSPAQAA